MTFLNYKDRRRILISGGAGFVGSHLVDKLMLEGHEVIVTDNYFTGRKRNVEHWLGHPNFELIIDDIVNPLYIEVSCHILSVDFGPIGPFSYSDLDSIQEEFYVLLQRQTISQIFHLQNCS